MMVVIQQTIETEKNLLNFHFGFSDLAIPFLLNPMSKKKKERERERKKGRSSAFSLPSWSWAEEPRWGSSNKDYKSFGKILMPTKNRRPNYVL